MKFKLTTTIADKTHTLTVDNAKTLQEAMNAFEHHLYDDYCYSFAMVMPLKVELVE